MSKLKPGKKDDDFGKLPKVPSHLLAGGNARVKIQPAEERVVEAGVDPASTEEGGTLGLPSESDLIFTDPDDVEASEAAIKGLFGPEQKDWLSSHTVAKNLSLVESKPLLIVFTKLPSARTSGSPASAGLDKELLARADFHDWASENLVRLKLDYNFKNLKSVGADKQRQDVLNRKKTKYLESLRKRYGVGGFPAMIVVAADGSVVQHVRGYRNGSAEYTWGLLKQGVVLSNDRQKKFEASLERKGYRRWQGKNDRKILAKLASYNGGEVLLIGPNGVRYQTKETNLSSDDRRWIEEQKEKRARR